MVGGIKSVSPFSALTGDGDDTNKKENENLEFCESCLSVGIKSKLHKRLWQFNTETKELVQVSEADRENFKQCYNCGDIIPVYEVKKESKIADFVETTDNPFDNNPGNMETFGKTPSQSVGLKKYKYKPKTHKDPEIQEFLDQGNEVQHISDHQ